MAELWFNHSENRLEIRGDVEDPELAEAALQAGYQNPYNHEDKSVFDIAREIESTLPEGFRVVVETNRLAPAPQNSIRIGQVTVRHGDPDYPLYVVRKTPRGRPTLTGEKLMQTALWLPREQIEWLKTHGNLSEQVRALIQADMDAKK